MTAQVASVRWPSRVGRPTALVKAALHWIPSAIWFGIMEVRNEMERRKCGARCGRVRLVRHRPVERSDMGDHCNDSGVIVMPNVPHEPLPKAGSRKDG